MPKVFKSEEGKKLILQSYDRLLQQWQEPVKELEFQTSEQKEGKQANADEA